MDYGHIALEGGAEFGGQMALPDRRCIDLAGGPDAPVVIIPTAAAPDNNHERAGANGRRWFTSLGATDICTPPLIDRASAADASIADALAGAGLIYLLGGFPGHLCETLRDTPAWEAVLTAHAQGAVLAGSSAGAMVLCDHLYDPRTQQVVHGLGLIKDACVLPHHNNFGQNWAESLRALLPDATLVGIDEETGAINDRTPFEWTVHGGGNVILYRPDQPTTHPETYRPGDEFTLPESPWVQRFL